jgi:multidrug efflux pump subunit AcrB
MKRIENVVLLKVIGTCELIAAIIMLYFFRDDLSNDFPALIGALILIGLSINSFVQAHRCYLRQYSPKKNEQ